VPDPDERDYESPSDELEDKGADSGSSDDFSRAAPVSIPEISDASDASPMREMVEYVARALASNPDAVQVLEEYDDGRTVYRLIVDESDKGKVIGRDGRVAQSIRSLLRVAATKSGTRVTLEID
jgi:hypothetical protein